MSSVILLGTLIFAYFLYTYLGLWRNYAEARRLGLPCIVVPIATDNPLWVVIQLTCKPFRNHFPWTIANFTSYLRMDWEFHDRYRTHHKLGDVFVIVTPSRNWIFVADPAAVHDILSRGKDFGRPTWLLKHLDVFGPSIATAEGSDWQRQRKLTAAPFNESKSIQIWHETIVQSTAMLQKWCRGPCTSAADDVRTLALHVLAYVAFHKSYSFPSDSGPATQRVLGAKMTYRDSMAIILRNTFTILAIPQWLLSLLIMPTQWQSIGSAMEYFRTYALDQIDAERRSIDNGEPASGTLISNLVRASYDSPHDSKRLKPLTPDEVLSDVFIYNFAGHDTTASSLAYTILLLVANPDVQDWVHEEIQYYTVSSIETGDLSYEEIFPKMTRIMAVMYETIRLYAPLPSAPRYTGNEPRHLTIGGKTYTIPADTCISPAIQTSHTDPRNWGADSLEWRPQRWIKPVKKSNQLRPFDEEMLITPPKGTYYPWSEGVRNCPGKKFSQVESAAVLLTLLRNHVARPVLKTGETIDEARQRVLAVVRDSNVHLLLEMKRPGDVSVEWLRRS